VSALLEIGRIHFAARQSDKQGLSIINLSTTCWFFNINQLPVNNGSRMNARGMVADVTLNMCGCGNLDGLSGADVPLGGTVYDQIADTDIAINAAGLTDHQNCLMPFEATQAAVDCAVNVQAAGNDQIARNDDTRADQRGLRHAVIGSAVQARTGALGAIRGSVRWARKKITAHSFRKIDHENIIARDHYILATYCRWPENTKTEMNKTKVLNEPTPRGRTRTSSARRVH